MTVNDEEIELILLDAGEKMEGAVSHARREFSTVRTGRASSALFERLTVEAYGVEMKLQELASFSVPEARQLIVTRTTSPTSTRSRRRSSTRIWA